MFSCYEKLKAIAEACQAPHFPNVLAVVAAIATVDPNQRAKASVQPEIFSGFHRSSMDLYDAVTPSKLQE